MTFGVFVPPFRPAFGLAAAPAPPAADWWEAGSAPTPIAVYQPKGAASLAASYVNLVNPGTHDAAEGVAPSWASGTGWTFDGMSQYLLTGLWPTSDASWAALVRFSGAPDETEAALLGATTALVISPGWWGTVRYYYAGGVTVSPRAASGVLAIAGRTSYRDGVADGTWSAGGWSDGELAIGAQLYSGSARWFVSASIQGVAIWDTSTDHATWMPEVMAAVALI